MTAIQTEFTTSPPRPSGRPWKRWLGVAAIAIAATSFYGFGVSRDKFKIGLEALDRGDFPLARRCVRELKASQPSSPQASFLRGAMLLEKGYFYPALEELDKAKQDAVLESASLTLTGQCWYRLGRHADAQAALLEALKQEPDSVDAHRWLAASYYDMGVVGEAVRHLERTAELDLTDPRPHRLLGLMHKDFGQYDPAIPLYEESLRRKSDQEDSDEIRKELASCQIETHRYNDALKTLTNCPDSAEFNVLRAECHHAQGRVGPAKIVLARALEEDKDNLEGLLLQGGISLEEEDARAAIEAFQRAIKNHPKDYTAHFKLAQAYGKAGEDGLAESEQKTAETIRVIRQEFAQLHKAAWERPYDIEVRLRLSALAKQLERPDLADVWLRSAAALQSFSESDGE